MRQYVSQKELNDEGLLTIIGKDYRYLRQVLRLKAGDMLSVRLPDSSLQAMTVCKIDEQSKKILLQVCDQKIDSEELENQPELDVENSAEYWLFMFVPKSAKFNLIVRQATECGVKKIIPVNSEFSQKGAEKANFRGERLERIIKEARQQSGSPVETVIEDCVSVSEACEIWKKVLAGENESEALGIVLYERSEFTTGLKKAAEACGVLKKCAVVCGAEGGISPEEIRQLREAGFKCVHFKTNILRCETAALYGMASLQSLVSEKE